MIRAEDIPDEVVKALTMLLLGHSLSDKNVSIAIAAAIAAWPGATHFPGMQRGSRETPPFITLPLPQKGGES